MDLPKSMQESEPSELNTEEEDKNTKKRKLPNWLDSNCLPKKACKKINKNKDENDNDKKTKSLVDKEGPCCSSTCTENNNTSMKKTNDIQPNNEINGGSCRTDIVYIKQEPVENSAYVQNEIPSQSNNSPVNTQNEYMSVKTEPLKENDDKSNNFDTKVKIEKADKIEINTSDNTSNKLDGTSKPPISSQDIKNEPQANSSLRQSCRFGIKCYRCNPVHRIEEAHPGDVDYRRPEYPDPPLGTPLCPYAHLCYRRNPMHFKQFYHPPQTNFQQNRLDRSKNLRNRVPIVYNAHFSDESSNDEDFSAGSEDEFVPLVLNESESDDEGVDVHSDDNQN